MSEAGTDELHPLTEGVLAGAAIAGGGAVVSGALRVWRPRHHPGPLKLVRAAAAGAGAAMARIAFERLLGLLPESRERSDPLAPVLAGAARGVLYAAVVEPRVPGPAVVRGACYGALEFAASPWGGLEGLLDSVPPHRRIPFLGALLDARDDEVPLAGHVLFGVILASLYGSPEPG